MAMGRKKRAGKQRPLFVATSEIARPAAANQFYETLNKLLSLHRFDERIEYLCKRYYRPTIGRPSLSPGVYFRCLFIGFFEGLDSERGIAWRAADSLSLRQFLGYEVNELPPDHSTLSRTRRLLSVETHKAVFRWVNQVLIQAGLIKGQTVSIDATTLEANAAMRSIVRRDTGIGYEGWLSEVARAEGLENATRQQLARRDRRRNKKASNKEWMSPVDGDARIAKMKDGRTHMAHKAEHAVDLISGALLAVSLQPADRGDTQTFKQTLAEAEQTAQQVSELGIEEVIADRGYHSGAVLRGLAQADIRSYIPEPDRGKRNWNGKAYERKVVDANRRRTEGDRGKRLQAKRGELVERSFAHMYETGAMRRVHLRGRDNILKRLLIQAGAFNLGLVLRTVLGTGKPRQLRSLLGFLFRLFQASESLLDPISAPRLLQRPLPLYPGPHRRRTVPIAN
jgi:transposase